MLVPVGRVAVPLCVCLVLLLSPAGAGPRPDLDDHPAPDAWQIVLDPPRPVAGIKLVGGRPSGCLHFHVRPSDTRIYIDGRYVGTVEQFDGWPDRLFLPQGVYRLRLNGPRGFAWRGQVRVVADHQVAIRAHRL